ncbi:hypothetical protein AX17_002374 [Amanita inopinata Kibby_2008]|nr:hypothetical protein AX17_002374 [Amanita inopinata Kibby_2008]
MSHTNLENRALFHASTWTATIRDTTTTLDPSLGALVNELAKLLSPLYTTLIVTCVWSAMLVPLLVALFFFSNRALRRKPIFIANVLSILLGLALSAVIIALMMSVLLHPLDPPSRSLSLVFASFLCSSSVLVESVLLIRLLAVYPYGKVPLKIFLAIFIPIGLLKTARVINIIIYLVDLSRILKPGVNTLLLLQQRWTEFPNYKIEWFLQVVDNTSASVLFLVRLNKGRILAGQSGAVHGGSWSALLEALFWIAVSNFVIPVVLSVAQLVVVWVDQNIFDVVPICLVNIYVEIIGVLLATVWAAGTKWQEEAEGSVGERVEGREKTGPVLSTIAFASHASSPSIRSEL